MIAPKDIPRERSDKTYIRSIQPVHFLHKICKVYKYQLPEQKLFKGEETTYCLNRIPRAFQVAMESDMAKTPFLKELAASGTIHFAIEKILYKLNDC